MKKTVSGIVIPPALAAYGFSEGAGLTTADATGNGHTLTLNSATWATGHTGTGIANTTTGQGAGANFVGPTAAITMMGWVQPLELPVGSSRVAMGFFQTGGNTVAAIFTERSDFGTPNVLQCNLRIEGTLRSLNGPALTVGTWVHVAITFDGALFALYVNGTLYASNTYSGEIRNSDVIAVGGTDPGNAYDSDVTVDDVRIFDIALNADQVALAMATPVV